MRAPELRANFFFELHELFHIREDCNNVDRLCDLPPRRRVGGAARKKQLGARAGHRLRERDTRREMRTTPSVPDVTYRRRSSEFVFPVVMRIVHGGTPLAACAGEREAAELCGGQSQWPSNRDSGVLPRAAIAEAPWDVGSAAIAQSHL